MQFLDLQFLRTSVVAEVFGVKQFYFERDAE